MKVHETVEPVLHHFAEELFSGKLDKGEKAKAALVLKDNNERFRRRV